MNSNYHNNGDPGVEGRGGRNDHQWQSCVAARRDRRDRERSACYRAAGAIADRSASATRRRPSDLKAIDIEVTPDGKGLPPGSGTAAAGKDVYTRRCETCHGPTGKEGPQDVLVGGEGSLATERPLKTVGSYWPYATTLWDYVRRAMPFDHPGTLTATRSTASRPTCSS